MTAMELLSRTSAHMQMGQATPPPPGHSAAARDDANWGGDGHALGDEHERVGERRGSRHECAIEKYARPARHMRKKSTTRAYL